MSFYDDRNPKHTGTLKTWPLSTTGHGMTTACLLSPPRVSPKTWDPNFPSLHPHAMANPAPPPLPQTLICGPGGLSVCLCLWLCLCLCLCLSLSLSLSVSLPLSLFLVMQMFRVPKMRAESVHCSGGHPAAGFFFFLFWGGGFREAVLRQEGPLKFPFEFCGPA